MSRFSVLFFLLLVAMRGYAAAPFDTLSLQGFLKTTAGVPIDGTYNGKISLFQNSAPCWNTGVTLVPITFAGGAFVKSISGGISSGLCSGTLSSTQFMLPSPFTWSLALDMDADNVVDTVFSNIPVTPVPLALVAEDLTGNISAGQIVGGAFGAIDASNLINLNASQLTAGIVPLARLGSGSPSSSTYLRGDGTWASVAGGSGEANTASNQGTGSGVFKQKNGVDLQLRSLKAASGKITVTEGTDEISFDVNGSAITNLNAVNIATGIVPAARLGTGTASASTYLRGDGSWQSVASSGENNTASNQGTGAGVFKQKTGVDLELRSLKAGSSKISVTEGTDEVSLDVAESVLNLANFAGNLSGSKITGGTFGAVNGSALTNLSASSLATGTVATARLGSGAASGSTYLRGDSTWASVPAAGEVNTGSSLGAGAGVFKQKTGVDLEFRSVAAASSKVSVVQNANDISLDVNEANLSLANIGGSLSGSQVSGGTLGAMNGSALTNLNASNLSSGTVPVAALPVASASGAGVVDTATQTFAGAKTFNSTLTLGSILAMSSSSVVTAATINCLSSSSAIVRLTGTTATAINGISPGVDGQILIIYTDGNIGTGLSFNHNNASACTNGRIFTNTAASVASATNNTTAAYVFVFNGPSLRWHMVAATP